MTTPPESPESDALRARARVRDWLFWLAVAVLGGGQAYVQYLALTRRQLVGSDAIAAAAYSIKTQINVVAVSHVEHTLVTFCFAVGGIMGAVAVLLGLAEWEDRRNAAKRAKLGDSGL